MGARRIGGGSSGEYGGRSGDRGWNIGKIGGVISGEQRVGARENRGWELGRTGGR